MRPEVGGVLVSLLMLMLLLVPHLSANSDLEVVATVGLDGVARLDRWFPVLVHLDNSGPPMVVDLSVETQGRFWFVKTVELGSPSRKQVLLYLPLEDFEEKLALQIRRSGEILAQIGLNVSGPPPGTPLVGWVGEPSRELTNTVFLTAEDLPNAWLGLDAIDILVLSGEALDSLSRLQRKAVRLWVLQGGRLLFSEEASRPLPEWMRHQSDEKLETTGSNEFSEMRYGFGRLVRLEDFASVDSRLEAFSKRGRRLPTMQQLDVEVLTAVVPPRGRRPSSSLALFGACYLLVLTGLWTAKGMLRKTPVVLVLSTLFAVLGFSAIASHWEMLTRAGRASINETTIVHLFGLDSEAYLTSRVDWTSLQAAETLVRVQVEGAVRPVRTLSAGSPLMLDLDQEDRYRVRMKPALGEKNSFLINGFLRLPASGLSSAEGAARLSAVQKTVACRRLAPESESSGSLLPSAADRRFQREGRSDQDELGRSLMESLLLKYRTSGLPEDAAVTICLRERTITAIEGALDRSDGILLWVIHESGDHSRQRKSSSP